MNDFVEQARLYATEAHARIDQRRKYSNQPYDVHLRSVAALVAEVTDDDEMIAAAWLHDTVEDTPATFRDIENTFGAGVACLVAELTDVSKPSDGNRAARKAIDRAHLARASDRAKTVKLADLIDNCRDICRHDPRFAQVFLAEMEALLRVLGDGDAVLLRRAHKAWNQCRERLDARAVDKQEDDDLDTGRWAGDRSGGPHEHALRQFTRAFSARDIAEPIASFDTDTAALKAREIMESNGWIVAGLRRAGHIDGYLRCEDLVGGVCGDHHRPFSRGQVVTADASLSEVIFVLTRYTGCYVDMIGDVAGVILREHIQKPIVRMWLFGMITIIEMNVTKRLAEIYPNDAWRELLTRGRLEKAEQLLAERSRRGAGQKLLDCLQLSDKIQILIKDDAQLAWMGFSSRRVAKGIAKEFESLRNNLAHSQDIVNTDWPQIARMTQRIEFLLGFEDE
jgi:hypothetical protein